MDRKKLIKPLVYIILFILTVNFIANKLYWYSSIRYFDMFMHFLGGIWVGLMSLYFFTFQRISLKLVVRVLLVVLAVGVGWEIFEFLVNDAFAQNPFNYLDTFSDIFFDLSGGLCAILYVLVPFKNQRTGNGE